MACKLLVLCRRAPVRMHHTQRVASEAEMTRSSWLGLGLELGLGLGLGYALRLLRPA